MPPSESKGPPKNRSAPSRAAPLRTGGDLSTRSRTHSLKVTSVLSLGRRNAKTTPSTLKVGPAPPYVPSTRKISRPPERAGAASEHADVWHSSGRAVLGVILPTRSRSLRALNNSKGGNPRGTHFRCGRPSHEAGRRRAIGAVAAFSPHLRATAPMVRRWTARGTSRGGPEGRRSGEITSKSDTAPVALHPLSHAMSAMKSAAIRVIRVPFAMAERPLPQR